MVEALLRSGVADDNPVWTPPHLQVENRRINAANAEIARYNPYHFNDHPWPFQKPTGARRLAVLGDSFVWGDGVRRNDIWSVKLKQKIQEVDARFEVLNWGRNGWSTGDELRFLETEGVKYELDYLVVGLVSNDPDPKTTPIRLPTWQDAFWLKPVWTFFPRTMEFTSGAINAWIDRHSDTVGYRAWEDTFYRPENLANYKMVLQRLKAICAEHDISLLVVYTPTNPDPHFAVRFAAIRPLLDEVGIAYLDTYPLVAERFRGVDINSLKANRFNDHPGPAMTELFAEATFQELRRREYVAGGTVAAGR